MARGREGLGYQAVGWIHVLENYVTEHGKDQAAFVLNTGVIQRLLEQESVARDSDKIKVHGTTVWAELNYNPWSRYVTVLMGADCSTKGYALMYRRNWILRADH